MRGELQELLREFGLPTLLVTHDYEDAAALADQVGVIVDGSCASSRSPQELVAQPGRRVRRLVHRREPAARGRAAARRTADRDRARERRERSTPPTRAEGAVGVVVYPWEVSVGARQHGRLGAERDRAARSARSSHVGNRVRVRIGPVTAEVTAASVEQLELARGGTAVASFKATGTRLVPFA